MGELVPQDQNPEQDRPIKKREKPLSEIANAKREAKRLQAQAAIPLQKAAKDEVIRRVKSGEVWEELKSMKLGALIRNLGMLKQILEENVPLIQVNQSAPPAASDGKDQTFFKAHSPTRLTEEERRRRIIDVEKEK
jgi:hypothetical protein